MRRKWKLGCGAIATVLTKQKSYYRVRIEARPDQDAFARVDDTWGANVELALERRAIPKVIKVLQYLDKQ